MMGGGTRVVNGSDCKSADSSVQIRPAAFIPQIRGDGLIRNNMNIEFGALAPRISEQLEQQGLVIDALTVAQLQRFADDTQRLHQGHLITDRERSIIEQRLAKAIGKQARRV
jgi:hypothetical protein